MSVEKINPLAIKEAGTSSKKFSVNKDFSSFMGAVNAMGPASVTAANMYGDVKAQSVLQAAFSGMGQMPGSSVPSYAMGTAGTVEGMMGVGGYSAMKYNTASMGKATGAADQIYPGVDMNTPELMNTMYQNNLQLLELQAMMQSQMQAWNTKSNVLSADHRARMAMIEKFTTR